ncbi:MAG: hypothetical protein ACOYMG_29100, partial [Candidatus Methylumidiphilus sp.]
VSGGTNRECGIWEIDFMFIAVHRSIVRPFMSFKGFNAKSVNAFWDLSPKNGLFFIWLSV